MPSTNLTLIRGGRQPNPCRSPLFDELWGHYRIRRLVEPDLAAEACLMLSDEELDALDKRVTALITSSNDGYDGHRAFHTDLLRPALTEWDLRVLRPLWEQADVLVRTGLALRGWKATELIRCVHVCHNLLAAYRTRNPEVTRAAHLRYLNLSGRLVQHLVPSIGWPTPAQRRSSRVPYLAGGRRPDVPEVAVYRLQYMGTE